MKRPSVVLPPRTMAADQVENATALKITDGSPLAIVGIFVSVLRERFAPDNGLDDYPWYNDNNTTKIFIESAMEEGNVERGASPALFVDKDDSVYGKPIIGDRAGYVIRNAHDYQWTLSTVPVIIECVASRRGESAVLGDLVQWSLHCMSDIIQATFGLHAMSPPTLGRTTPYEGDTEGFTSPVSFTVQYNVRWVIKPVQTLMQELVGKISATGQDANEYFIRIALRDRDI